MYDAYARVYQAIGQPAIGIYILTTVRRWLQQQAIQPHAVLDLGCGTGAVAVALALDGCVVSGIDRSAAMLDLARQHAHEMAVPVTWQQVDVTQWQPSRDYDLVLSCYDTLNYLLNADDLRMIMQQVARALHPGGIFAFDLNMPHEYATWVERSTITADTAAFFVYNVLHFDHATQIAEGRIAWFERVKAGWQHGTETHYQRAHTDAEVSAALAAAGLDLRARLAIDGAAADPDSATRIVYIAQKSFAATPD